MNKKQTSGVRRGSAMRCMTPLLLYVLLETAASCAVVIVLYRAKGLLAGTYSSAEELYVILMSALSENYDQVTQASMVLTYLVLIPLFYLMYRKDRAMNRTLGFEKVPAKAPGSCYPILLLAGAAFCLGGSVMMYMSGLEETSTAYQESSQALLSGAFLLQLFLLGILSPVTEELLYRGLVYRRLKERYPLIPSMIISSLIFAAMHANLVQGIYAFCSGMLLVYAYERYGSLKACMCFHIGANVIAVIGSETDCLDFLVDSKLMMYAGTFLLCILVLLCVYYIEAVVRPFTEGNIEKKEECADK